MRTLHAVDEIEPRVDDEPRPVPTIGIMAVICEPDGTDRSSRITLPIDSGDEEIVYALREVSVSAARLRGIPDNVADWHSVSEVDVVAAGRILREWVTERIAAGRVPDADGCRDLIFHLLRKVAP